MIEVDVTWQPSSDPATCGLRHKVAQTLMPDVCRRIADVMNKVMGYDSAQSLDGRHVSARLHEGSLYDQNVQPLSLAVRVPPSCVEQREVLLWHITDAIGRSLRQQQARVRNGEACAIRVTVSALAQETVGGDYNIFSGQVRMTNGRDVKLENLIATADAQQ